MKNETQVTCLDAGGNGHIRCLSVIPADLELLLKQLEESSMNQENEIREK